MMIKIVLIAWQDRADGKSTKACFEPSAITVLRSTIETKEKRDEGCGGADMAGEWMLGENEVGNWEF